MNNAIIPALVATGGLATAGSAAVRATFRAARQTWHWWHTAAALAGVVNLLVLAVRANAATPPMWLRHSFDMTILLATLVLSLALLCPAVARLRGLDGFLLPLAAVIQAAAFLGLLRGAQDVPRQAPPWFVLHMLTLAMGAACFLAGGTAGLVYLVTNRILRKKKASLLLGQVPPLESLERFCRWMLTGGLPFFTFGILTGICEMVQADEPAVWLRDEVVLLSFALWLAYAVVLVAIWLQPRNRGRRAAVLSASGVAVLLVVLLVLSLFSTAHR